MKYFKNLLFIALSFFLTDAIYSQELVPNGGFEEGTIPDGREQFIITVDDWEQDGGADLFDVNTTNTEVGIPDNYVGNQDSRGGTTINTRYAGLSAGAFSSSANDRTVISTVLLNPIECCKKYVLSFYASKGECIIADDGSCHEVANASDIRIKLHNSHTWGTDNPDFKLSVENETDWTHFVIPFNAERDYSHLLIGTNFKGLTLTKAHYFYIDDVSLIETDVCNSLLGCFNIVTNNAHFSGEPFCITNLSNVKKIEIDIATQSSGPGTNLGTFVLENPPNTICWNGRGGDNFSGSALMLHINYDIIIKLTNDCKTEIFEIVVSKTEEYTPQSTETAFFTYTPVTKSPIPCCQDDISISNQNLVQDKTLNEPLKYIAKNNIFIGSGVTIESGNNVKFCAANSIEGISEMEVEVGAEVEGILEDCNNVSFCKTGPNNNENIIDDTINVINPKTVSISEIPTLPEDSSFNMQRYSLTINPNPIKNKTNITFNIINEEVLNANISDIYGNVIDNPINNKPHSPGCYKLTYDASNLGPGIYYYTLHAGNYIETRKMVVVK